MVALKYGQLTKYVKKELDRGFSLDRIKEKLILAGYDDEAIDHVIHKVADEKEDVVKEYYFHTYVFEYLKKLSLGIEEIIIFLIIALNVLDITGNLFGELDFLKKVISWTAIGYVFGRLQISRVLFGHRNKTRDRLILATFFLLVIKGFVHYFAADETQALSSIFTIISIYSAQIQFYSFTLGTLLLIVTSVVIGLRSHFAEPSILAMLIGTGDPPDSLGKKLLRVFLVLFVLTSFYLFIFDPIMEWLSIAVDAPLLMIALFYYLLMYKKHHETSIIHRAGDAGDRFIQQFINLFLSKRTLFLGVAGLICLRVLVDLSVFIIPYITGVVNPYYFAGLDPATHVPLVRIAAHHVGITALPDAIGLAATYLFTILAVVGASLWVPMLWAVLKNGRAPRIPAWLLSIFLASLTSLILNPALAFKPMIAEGLVGVDITTFPAPYIGTAFAAALFVFIASLLAHHMRRLLIGLATAASLLLFTVYNLYFLQSIMAYYYSLLEMLAGTWYYHLMFAIVLFMVTTALFYLFGYVTFLVETVRSVRMLSEPA